MRSMIGVVMLACMLTCGGGAFAQGQQALDDCASGDPDRRIAGCSQVIGAAQRISVLADAYYARGRAFYENGELDRAIADFTDLIRIHPSSNAYNARGVVQFDKGAVERAIDDYTQAISRNPDNQLALNNRGDAFMNLREFDRAIADFTGAIRVDPGDAIAYSSRSEAYFGKGALDRAMADIAEAMRRQPDNHLAYVKRGDIRRNKGDLQAALADYSEAVRLNPGDAVDAYWARSIVYLVTNENDLAFADIEKAREISPGHLKVALWFDIISQRSGRGSRLAEILPQLDMATWPAPLVKFYLGQVELHEVIKAASHPYPEIKRWQFCEANFYLGEKARLEGRRDDAMRFFKTAITGCPVDFVERDVAKFELEAFNTTGHPN